MAKIDPTESRPLDGKIALITGGTSKIGESIVRRLVSLGADVNFTYCSDESRAEQLTHELKVSAFSVNLLDQTCTFPDLAVDILVNNAAINNSGWTILDTRENDVRHAMEVNFVGPLRLIRTYAPHMVESGWGRVINVNSLWGTSVSRRRLGYSASKHALSALTKTAALELAEFGTTVNEVLPGPVRTAMLTSMGSIRVHEGDFPDEESYLLNVASGMPIGRLISPESIAAAVASLIRSDDINGASLTVDGGLHLT
jgi:3-hydroxybutyrate dehydrogenase